LSESSTSRQGAAWFAAAAGFAILGLGATFVDFPSERARAFLLLTGLFFSTGLALLSAARTKCHGALLLALAFPLSCAVLYLPLFAGELLGLGTRLFAWLVRPLLLVSAILLAREAGRRGRPVPGLAPLLAAAGFSALLSLSRGALVTIPSDAPDYIASIREIQSTGLCFPLTTYYARSTEERIDARKGFLFPAAGAAGSLVGAGPRAVYDALPAVAAFLFAISFFALAREALRDGPATWLAFAFGLLSFEGGLLGTWFARSGSPYLFAAPALWTALLLVLAASSGARGLVLPALATGFALMGTHVFAAVTALALGGLFAIAIPFVRGGGGRWKGAFAALALLGIGSVPIGIWRIVKTYPALDPVHTHLQGILWVTDRLYVASPLLAFERVSLFGLLGIPFSLLLIRRAREDVGILFAVSTTLLPFLLILNPLLVPLLVPVFGYLLGRVLWFGGYFLVLGRLAADCAAALRARRSLLRSAAAVGALALLGGCLASSLKARDAIDWRKRILARPERLADAPAPEIWSDLFAFMERNLPAGATVATDPITGYLIPACTPQKAVAILEQHGSTGDPRAPERVEDMIRAMSPYVSGAETAGILRRRGAAYVLVNFRLDVPVTSYVATLNPELYAPTLEKFRREPERYRPVYEKDRCHLFEFEEGAGPVQGEERPVLTAAADSLPGSARRVGRLFANGVRLAGVRLAGDTVRAGETLALTCYWIRERDAEDVVPYKAYFRLVRAPGGDPMPRGKWARKAHEIRTGRLLRARTMRNLVQGALPLSDWPPGGLLADDVRWSIPSDLEPGDYDLEIALRRSPFVHVSYLRDFLTETDSFSGAAAGRVVVRAAGAPIAPGSAETTAGGSAAARGA
jgi:hypothetical protein